ncbi:homeodomain-only protein isoform X1 [Carettochelys insculpta]|uniref:homeodomain-only protein isoform X1 n=1 Tax=Carettochelys insculpta TaxID=44489 RepID=UPI003EBECFDB
MAGEAPARLTPEQLHVLEVNFCRGNRHPDPATLCLVAAEAGLSEQRTLATYSPRLGFPCHYGKSNQPPQHLCQSLGQTEDTHANAQTSQLLYQPGPTNPSKGMVQAAPSRVEEVRRAPFRVRLRHRLRQTAPLPTL